MALMWQILLIFTIGSSQFTPGIDYDWCILNSMINLRYFDTCRNLRNNISKSIYIEGMIGEYENTQLLFEHHNIFELSKISFKVSDLVNKTNTSQSTSLSSSIIKLYRVGNVNCKKTMAYVFSGGGWRPDPIFELDDGKYGSDITVSHEYTQSVWINIHIPYNTLPLLYQGNITVSIQSLNNYDQFTIPLTLNVWNITVPTTLNARFQNVFAFNETDLLRLYPSIYYEEMKYKYFNLLSSYRVPPDAIYTNPRPIDDYKYLVTKTQWTNLANVANFSWIEEYDCSATPGNVQEIIDTVNETLLRLEANGMNIESFYVYGFDESQHKCLPGMYGVYNTLHSIWPNLRTMSPINWQAMPPLNLNLDAWVAIYYEYEENWANEWVKNGRQQWLYHSDDPRDNQSLNTFIEEPLMMSRILFWLGAKWQAQGWLYWAINRWKGCPQYGVPDKGIIQPDTNNLTFTNFDPATYDYCGDGNLSTTKFINGDGFYIYPGEYGPVPSIRLQNVRDGFEDIELFKMLKDKEEMEHYINQIVVGVKNYTLDPTLLNKVRREVANKVLSETLLKK